jgi:KaiC/GvpD/RAD55 family RecA-like ATPase
MHRVMKVMAAHIIIIINQETYIIIIILSIQTIGLESMVKRAIIENPPKKSAAIIPSELMQFVKHNTYSLLIKGYSGTGKTTLSLSILRVLNIKSNFFYISTRISPRQIFIYYPWLSKFVDDGSRISKSVENGYNLSSFEDARLDEPESFFERITNQLMDVKAPVIVIDTWDAIASFMDKEARLNNERVLQTWRERAGAKLIFISEDPMDTTLDFLVDGIVELKQIFYDNIRIREILLSKLRGVRINKPSYIYTLNNAIFRSCNPLQPTKFVTNIDSKIFKKRQQKLAPLYNGTYITSGYLKLDAELKGGFQKGSIVLVETDADVNVRTTMSFLAKIMYNFVGTCNPILFGPSGIFEPAMVIAYLKSYLHADPKSELVKILWPTNRVEHSISEHIIPPPQKWNSKRRFEYFQHAVLKIKEENPNKLLLNIMGTEINQKVKSFEKKDQIQEILPFIRENVDLSLFVIQRSENIQESLYDACDIHIRLRIINGSLFLQLLSTDSPLYEMINDTSSGYSKIELEPMV